MRQFTDAELKVLIRDAAMNRWMSDNDDDWKDVRAFEDGWTEQETSDFLNYYSNQIQQAHHQIDGWMDGKGDFV